jgi:hypothetical protein
MDLFEVDRLSVRLPLDTETGRCAMVCLFASIPSVRLLLRRCRRFCCWDPHFLRQIKNIVFSLQSFIY